MSSFFLENTLLTTLNHRISIVFYLFIYLFLFYFIFYLIYLIYLFIGCIFCVVCNNEVVTTVLHQALGIDYDYSAIFYVLTLGNR